MPTIKVGKTEVTFSERRLIRHSVRMQHWSPERRAHAHEAAKKRLHGKHHHKRDAAIYAASEVAGAI
jgi:hypothetical protein